MGVLSFAPQQPNLCRLSKVVDIVKWQKSQPQIMSTESIWFVNFLVNNQSFKDFPSSPTHY